MLRTYLAYDALFTGGVSVAAGDVTGDGLADIVVAPGPGLAGHGSQVRIFDSTADGPAVPRAYCTAYPGLSIAVRVALLDADGDGDLDVVTAPGSGLPAAVQAFDPLTGELVGSQAVFDALFLGGRSSAPGRRRFQHELVAQARAPPGTAALDFGAGGE